MIKKSIISGTLAGVLSVGMALTSIPAVNVLADDNMGWVEENGIKYWYENGVKQGTQGRGKEIYDPSSDAWYWLDSIDGGKMAVSKDVYQESLAGQWGDNQNENGEKIGKWVRYDENGHMVKGWDEKDGNRYYFDPIFGTMAKGEAFIDGYNYYFNQYTGIWEWGGPTDDDGNYLYFDGWHRVGGVNYWYEKGVRQGYRTNADGSIDESYRGKEIYDPSTDAWYWLDSVQQGAVAKDKDVYQDSKADDAGNIGKWVRYDSEGHMVKGWNEKDGNRYYFNTVYGTMAKGRVRIDGKIYEFDENTGILLRELDETVSYKWICTSERVYTVDGKFSSESGSEYNADGTIARKFTKCGKKYDSTKGINYALDDNDIYVQDEKNYIYEDGSLKQIVRNVYSLDNSTLAPYIDYSEVEVYNTGSGKVKEDTYTYYKTTGEVNYTKKYEYDDNGHQIAFYKNNPDGSISSHKSYEYNESGLKVKETEYGAGDVFKQVKTFEYDGNGKNIKVELRDTSGNLVSAIERTFENNNLIVEKNFNSGWNLVQYTQYSYNGSNITEKTSYYVNGGNNVKSSRTVYEYDEKGSRTRETTYSYKSSGEEYIYSRIIYTYEDYAAGTRSYHLLSTRDLEYSRWDDGRQDYVLEYNYGDKYIYNNGILTNYVRHKYNNQTTDYFECYDSYTFPTGTEGASFDATCTRRFDSGNQQVSYTVKTYKYIGKETSK